MTKNDLIILDIDETLIYASSDQSGIRSGDFMFGPFWIYKRPYLDEFLNYIVPRFTLAVWTTATKEYAEYILNQIHLEISQLHFFKSREDCRLVQNQQSKLMMFIKDISSFHDVISEFSNSYMIDDQTDKIISDSTRVIKIKSFHGEESDMELKILLDYFKKKAEL